MGQNSDPMNLVGAGTASGAYAALRQMIADKIAAEERARRAMVEDRNFGLQNRQLDLQDQMRRDTLAETTRQHGLADEEKRIGLANTLGDQIPAGTEMAPTDPAVGLMAKGGRLSLLKHEDPTMASTSLAGFSSLPGGPKQVVGTLRRSADAAKPERFIKQASAKQLDTTTDNERQAAQLKQQGANQDWQNTIRQELADLKAGAGPKTPTPHYQLQPEIDPATGAQTGRFLGFNTATNSWEPVKGQGPQTTKPAPGAAATATQEHKKKEALTTLDQIDVAIENARDLIGPGAGRVGKLEQLVGNPDPRLNALGTKLLMGKMQVDAGIGGARAAASPQLLSRWDNLLSQNLTPEALKASTQALREILGASAAPSGSGIKSITEIK